LAARVGAVGADLLCFLSEEVLCGFGVGVSIAVIADTVLCIAVSDEGVVVDLFGVVNHRGVVFPNLYGIN